MNEEESREEDAVREYGNLFTNDKWKALIDEYQFKFLKQNMSGLIICHGVFKNVIYKYLGDGLYEMTSSI